MSGLHGAAAGGPRALLSDCDGVIVDSEPLAERVMVDHLSRAFDRHRDDLAPRIARCFGQRVLETIEALEQELAQPLTPAMRRRLVGRIDDEVAAGAPALPQVQAVYASLGLPVGVVSNSGRARVLRCVERAGLAALVGRHVYSADEVAAPKPAPDVYLHAAASMAVAPAHCVVVEDSVAGVLAACAAGMRTFGFLGGSHLPPGHGEALRGAGVMALFESMPQLPALLRGG